MALTVIHLTVDIEALPWMLFLPVNRRRRRREALVQYDRTTD
jgi:hypothetical protein